jgi:hypothetical protein
MDIVAIDHLPSLIPVDSSAEFSAVRCRPSQSHPTNLTYTHLPLIRIPLITKMYYKCLVVTHLWHTTTPFRPLLAT